MHWLELILSRLRIRSVSIIEYLLYGAPGAGEIGSPGLWATAWLLTGGLFAFGIAHSIRHFVLAHRRGPAAHWPKRGWGLAIVVCTLLTVCAMLLGILLWGRVGSPT